jgi:uncharacterized protein YkwD
VCGNLLCDPGEDGDTCAEDCGPLPWPSQWEAEAMSFATMVNQTRMNGYACPGQTFPATTPLTRVQTLDHIARSYSWARSVDYVVNEGACNGLHLADLAMLYGETGVLAMGAPGDQPVTAATALGIFLGDTGKCAALLDPTLTVIGVGYTGMPKYYLATGLR